MRGDRTLAVEAHEELVAHDGAAGVNRNSLKRACAPIARHQRRDMQSAGARAGDLDVIDMGLVADHELERRVDLIVAVRGAFVAFDQHGARALLDHTSERVKIAAGRRPELTKTRWIGRASVEPARDPNHRAVAHEGGIERDRDVIGSARPCRDAAMSGSPAASACAIERMRQARLEVREIGQLRRRTRRRRTRCGAPRSRRASRRRLRARAFAAASGGAASGLASRIERAQVGVFPLLDPPVRQALPRRSGRNASSRSAAHRRPRPASRAPWPRRKLASASARLGRGLASGGLRAFIRIHLPSSRSCVRPCSWTDAVTPSPGIARSLASSSSASSLPPVRTMRPFDSTCTTSGTM